MSRLLVALQFGLMALMAVRLDPAAVGFAFVALMALGLAVGGWALWANRPGNFHIRPDPHGRVQVGIRRGTRDLL